MTRSSMPARSVKGLLLLLSMLTAIACGGAPEPAAKSPASESTKAPKEEELPEPRTVEEAQEQIARAKETLEGGRPLGAAKATTEEAARAAPAPPSAATGREERPDDTCGSPCRALASMRRAVEALCRMTGDTDDRCVDARRTLGDNTTRISSCRCDAR